MSNKIVPTVYRTIIDDVIANVRADFDEFGVEEDLLALLQQKWEHKLLASKVANFEAPPQPAASTSRQPAPPPIPPLPKQEPNPSHQQMLPPMSGGPGLNLNLGLALPVPRPAGVPLAGNAQQNYGQQVFGQQQAQQQQQQQQQQQAQVGQQQWNGGLRGGGADDKGKGPARLRGGAGQGDGDHYAVVSGSESSDDESDSGTSSIGGSPMVPVATPAPTPAATRPPPAAQTLPRQANEFGIFPGDEEINSDLDDSDDEIDNDDRKEDGEEADENIVFCVYDKVNRVKNKWKMVFRDGMAKVNGKDYLFAKATCDVEW